MTWLAVHKKSAHEAKNPQNIYEELILPVKKKWILKKSISSLCSSSTFTLPYPVDDSNSEVLYSNKPLVITQVIQ